MIAFYARVSSKEQNLARQLETAKEYHPDRIYTDKESGKNFDRKQYQLMKSELKRGDTVIVKSLDRLGRNKTATKDEMRWFHDNGIILRVLNIPTTLIEYPKGQEWVMDMVNNILIEVIGTIAEQERETIRSRQAEGIAAMEIRDGKHWSARKNTTYGRKGPDDDIIRRINEGENWENLGISRATWYRHRNKAVSQDTADPMGS